jgi:hypothetical protein
MTTYTAYFYTDGDFATRRFDADTPEQALALARQRYDDDPVDLMFEPYEGGLPVNEIAIHGADYKELAVWRDDAKRMQLAACDLLDALTDLVERDRAEAASCGFTDDEMSWLEDARRAIAKAKGGAP